MATRTVNARPRTKPSAATAGPKFDARAVAASVPEVDTRPTLAQRIRQLLPAIMMATVVVEAMVVYRIWAQVTGSIPAAAPGSWAYGLAGSLVAPFRRYDTAVPINEAPILDFAALIALEAYLAVGVAAGLAVFVLSHAPLLARFRPWTWRIDLAPAGRAAGNVASATSHELAGVFSVARRGWVRADLALGVLTQRCVAYLRSRDWAGYRAQAADRWTRASTATRERAQTLAAKPDWDGYKTRATVYKTRATEGWQRARTTAASRGQELIASRDWSRDRQRVIEAKQAALERSRIVAQKLDISYHRGTEDVRRIAGYSSPRARRLLIDTGRALYVRGPQSAGWLSSRLGSSGARGGASLIAMLSARPTGGDHSGPTVSRREFLRLATPRADQQ